MIIGGPHDFSATGPFTNSSAIAPSGSCSACHIPHGADISALWPRALAAYRTNLQDNGDASIPNYVSPPTIQCYDCHDFHGVGGINNDPRDTDFNSEHRPQNVAAGFTRNNPPGTYNSSNMSEDAWGGSVSGYYENRPPFPSNYGADPNLHPTTDNTDLHKTGGHYFKTADPTGSAGDNVDIGDKLPCRDCHDPHAWASDWQAFIKPNLGGATGWSRITPGGKPTASRYMANAFTPPGVRSDSNSRTLCIACHAYSNTLTPVNFSDISPAYSAGAIVRPPDSIAEHRATSDVACVSCHDHNSVDASCAGCHGDKTANTFWPDSAATTALTGYPDRAGQHPVHVKRIGERKGFGSTPSSYTTAQQREICAFCHDDLDSGLGGVGPSGHYASGYTKANAPADVRNMNFMWSPYDNDANGVYDNATYSGDTFQSGSTCGTADCHYDVTTPAWYATAAANCSLCHSSTGTTGTGEPWTIAGAHGAHDNAFTISTGVNDTTRCQVCHTGYVPASMDFVATLATHIDNNRQNVAFPEAYSQRNYNPASPAGSYSGTDNGTCANVNCHGSNTTQGWKTGTITTATVSNANCMDTCHRVETISPDTTTEYQSARSGKHQAHINGNKACGDCHATVPANHYAVLADNVMVNPNNIAPAGGAYTDCTTGAPPPYYSPTGKSGSCTTSCHQNVDWDPAAAGGCAFCHGSTKTRSAGGYTYRVITGASGDFGMASHHIDGIAGGTVDGKDCSQCHWEGDPATGARTDYHTSVGSDLGPGVIDLRIWTGTAPPTVYTVGTTALVVNPTAAPTDNSYNPFCLGCHNDTNATTNIFYGPGGTRTQKPALKAWDGNSVASKYGNTGTTPFGKFNSTTYNVLSWDRVPKAYSPHGNVANNRGGYASAGAGWSDRGGGGAITAMPGTRAGMSNVACCDCHNAHGSGVANMWWRATATDNVAGGILKDLVATGKGTYRPAAGTGYTAEADLCWGCHLGDGAAPKTYATYGFASGTGKIGYYHENVSGGQPARWSGTLSWVSSFTFKNGTIMSDHFGTVTESAPRTTIPGVWTKDNMSCGSCHDPHGVSSAQTNAQYMVPALKGTWVTSPYKEDRPPRTDNPGATGTMFNQNDSGATTWKDKYSGYPAPRANPEWNTTIWANSLNFNVPTASGGGMGLTKYQWTGASAGAYNSDGTRLGWDGYFIDENTFGTMGAGTRRAWKEGNTTYTVTVNRMTTAAPGINSPTVFGGLCLVCHPQANIQNLTSTTQGGESAKVHNTVMGWATTNTNIFHRGLRAAGLWYGNPPTMHGMDHISYDATSSWAQDAYGPTGPAGSVNWDEKFTLPQGGTKDNWLIDNTAIQTAGAPSNAHRYMWGPAPTTQGSGGSDGAETAYHQFPCSKCHSPHVARLPRLMRTNCADNDGTNTVNWGGNVIYKNQAGVVLFGNLYRNVACHSTYLGAAGTTTSGFPTGQDANGLPTPAPATGGWNAVTPW